MLNDKAVAAEEPFNKFLVWYSGAQTDRRRQTYKGNLLVSSVFGLVRKVMSAIFPWANLFRPDVATLATIGLNGQPSARSVLFTGITEGGFAFYTDYDSDKGKELDLNLSAVMLFYWAVPPRQVRIDGKVHKLSREDAGRYWESRSRANQLAAAAVIQSSIISGREEHLEKVRQLEQLYRGKPIPCPDSWGGYSLVPEKIEFWEGKIDWLHDRERYLLNDGNWTKIKLAP
ncbi:MAG: pyridoxal 5'-phosphate synthase [Dehalococcoidales bacterium]|nr:pyridoxal 5'-phosphate synthase [Dehalococcoidales bacterium]